MYIIVGKLDTKPLKTMCLVDLMLADFASKLHD